MFQYQHAPFIITLLFMTLWSLFFLWILYRKRRKQREKKKFIEQLNYASTSYTAFYEEEKLKRPISERWNYYWGDLLKKSEMVPKGVSDQKIGTGMVLVPIVIWIMFSFTGNPGIGIVPALGILLFISFHAKAKIKKKQEKLNDQIPSFIAALKSNVQANETPEKALINAINTTSSPLYDELEIAKALSATSTFTAALSRLRVETSSKELRFLCSCIELSSKLGANLEGQLTIIEEMMEANRDLNSQMDKAVADNKPLLYVSAAVLPIIFIFMYMTNEATRNFWFKNVISWVVFIFVIVLYGGAVFLSNKFIKDLEEWRR